MRVCSPPGVLGSGPASSSAVSVRRYLFRILRRHHALLHGPGRGRPSSGPPTRKRRSPPTVYPGPAEAWDTTAKGNVELIRRLYEEIDRGNEAVLDELFAEDFVGHDASPTAGPPSGLADLKLGFERSAAAFKDSEHVIEDIFAAGDKVVVRILGKGRHTGAYQGAPPTGKAVTEGAIAIYRIAGGKIVEEWSQADRLGFLRQLGTLPPERSPRP